MSYASLAAFPAEGCSVSNMEVGSVRALAMCVVRSWGEDGKLVLDVLGRQEIVGTQALGLWEWMAITTCHGNEFNHVMCLPSISIHHQEPNWWPPRAGSPAAISATRMNAYLDQTAKHSKMLRTRTGGPLVLHSLSNATGEAHHLSTALQRTSRKGINYRL